MVSIITERKRTINVDNQYDFTSLADLSFANRKTVFAILSLLKTRDEKGKYPKISINTQYLQRLSDNKSVSKRNFINELEALVKELSTKFIKITQEDGQIDFIPVFMKISINPSRTYTELWINPMFIKFFVNLKSSYFWFLLEDTNKIKSSMALKLFIKLSQFKYIGKVSLSVKNTKELLGLSSDLDSRYVTRKLKYSANKLKPYFNGIKVKSVSIYGSSGNKLSSYTITFARQRFNKNSKPKPNKDIKVTDEQLPF